ncbi:MAG: nucleotide exchange factor GrpE [Solirubrobacterales bacterium]
MTTGRRAGEPDVPASPAGAPQESADPAGTPKDSADPAAAEAGAERAGGLDALEEDLDRLLNEARSERDEYLELAQRTRADFENYRRRAAQDAEEAGRRAKSSLARELVPSLDNLERALRAAGIDPDAEDHPGTDPAEPEAPAEDLAGNGSGLAHGVLLVYRELRSTLERAGVETYDPAGERFDPTWHEALATRAQDGTEAGVVLETVEKGYRLDGQVLRAARVVVSE